MEEPVQYLLLTVLTPSEDVSTAAIGTLTQVQRVEEPDPDTTIYYLIDPAGSDDSVLRVTIYAGEGSEGSE